MLLTTLLYLLKTGGKTMAESMTCLSHRTWKYSRVVVAHAFNSNTWESEAGGSL